MAWVGDGTRSGITISKKKAWHGILRTLHQGVGTPLYLSLGRVPLRSDLGSWAWKDTVFVAPGMAVLTASCCWYCRAVFSRTSARMTALRLSFSSSSASLVFTSCSSFFLRSTMAVLLVRKDFRVWISHSALRRLSWVWLSFSTSLSKSCSKDKV